MSGVCAQSSAAERKSRAAQIFNAGETIRPIAAAIMNQNSVHSGSRLLPRVVGIHLNCGSNRESLVAHARTIAGPPASRRSPNRSSADIVSLELCRSREIAAQFSFSDHPVTTANIFYVLNGDVPYGFVFDGPR